MKMNSTPKSVRSSVAKLFAISIGFAVLVGCSQNIEQVSIKARPKPPTFYVYADIEHQGGNAQGSVSASTGLGAEALGGNFTRTNSSSSSFTMTSGIGVD